MSHRGNHGVLELRRMWPLNFDLATNEPGCLFWTDVSRVRQTETSLELFTEDGDSHRFACSGLRQDLDQVVVECVNHSHVARGLPSLLESVETHELECPCCGQTTQNLKFYGTATIVFMFVYVISLTKQFTRCPKCMRRSIYKMAIINLLTANLIWPFLIAPVCFIQWIRSFYGGHSNAVLAVLEARYAKELTA